MSLLGDEPPNPTAVCCSYAPHQLSTDMPPNSATMPHLETQGRQGGLTSTNRCGVLGVRHRHQTSTPAPSLIYWCCSRQDRWELVAYPSKQSPMIITNFILWHTLAPGRNWTFHLHAKTSTVTRRGCRQSRRSLSEVIFTVKQNKVSSPRSLARRAMLRSLGHSSGLINSRELEDFSSVTHAGIVTEIPMVRARSPTTATRIGPFGHTTTSLHTSFLVKSQNSTQRANVWGILAVKLL